MNHRPDPVVIQSMFSKVASKYDRANTILSFGIHHLWRRKVVAKSNVSLGQTILDCATGTGDLAIAYKKAVGPQGSVIGSDFNADMLRSAPFKAQKENLEIKFEIADVTCLQYESSRFDLCSIAFGIRNVSDPILALKEMSRVCKPGGKVVILEFGQMSIPLISAAYEFYSEKILPKIGGLVTGQMGAYDYLQKSSAAFPSREKFLDLMDQANVFSEKKFYTLSFGIAYIYIGRVR